MMRFLVLNLLLAFYHAKHLLTSQDIENFNEDPILITKNFKIREIIFDPTIGSNDTNIPPIIPKQRRSCSNVNFAFTSSDQSASLKSINYPMNYPLNTDCSYFINSPAGTQMKFSCDVFNVACDNDFFFYSLSGSPTFYGLSAYCGIGNLSGGTTPGNNLSIAFHSGRSRPLSKYAYRYSCTISVIRTPTTTTTPVTVPTTTPATKPYQAPVSHLAPAFAEKVI